MTRVLCLSSIIIIPRSVVDAKNYAGE